MKIDVPSSINLPALQAAAGEAFTNSIKHLITGAAEDLQQYGLAIAKDLVEAQREVDPEHRTKLTDELKAQGKALLEVNRLRVNSESWDGINIALDAVSGIVSKVLAGAILAL